MRYTLHVSHLAETDLAEVIDWYDNIRPGLGADLSLCVEEALDRIAENPHAFPIVHLTAHRSLIRRFPYAIFFRVRESRIEIEAIFHSSRDPITWQGRIG